MNLADVISYGPIVAFDEEWGVLVTGNGAYFNIWIRQVSGGWSNVDCCPTGKDMYQWSAADFLDAGKEALSNWLEEVNSDEDDDGQ